MNKLILFGIASLMSSAMSSASAFATEGCTNFSGQWSGFCKSLDSVSLPPSLDHPALDNPGAETNFTILQIGCDAIQLSNEIKTEEYQIGITEDLTMRWNNNNTMLVFAAKDESNLPVMGSLVLEGTSLVIDTYEINATVSRCVLKK